MSAGSAEHQRLMRIVIGALRSSLTAHGPIDASGIGSAAKRITNQILADAALHIEYVKANAKASIS